MLQIKRRREIRKGLADCLSDLASCFWGQRKFSLSLHAVSLSADSNYSRKILSKAINKLIVQLLLV